MFTGFINRHIGPREQDQQKMLQYLSLSSVGQLTQRALPDSIRSALKASWKTLSEGEALEALEEISKENIVSKNFIGLGYFDTVTPAVIQRNILENPSWYTAYTPYQAEISQGRMEALLNFQTMISELTGLPIANASLLDEATAAAEAMMVAFRVHQNQRKKFFVSHQCLPQTIDVIKTRAYALGLDVIIGNYEEYEPQESEFGILLQYPMASGIIADYESIIKKVHQKKGIVILAADLLALTLIKTPGEMGADIAVGTTQRFGIPMGFGGPHAAYFATKESYQRLAPGRFIGVSKDSQGRRALRLALQTREQHIRRDKATSNICTSQVLLAVMASMYAIYHGPEGLKKIALEINRLTQLLSEGLKKLGFQILSDQFFDTVSVKLKPERKKEIQQLSIVKNFNFRLDQEEIVGISLGESASEEVVKNILKIFSNHKDISLTSLKTVHFNSNRKSDFLTQSVYNSYHSETEMLRYIYSLEKKDLSLTTSMIPLGSCTMKLNATTEMIPLSWKSLSQIHPFAPQNQVEGYIKMIHQLENWLCELTGLAACSVQPNAGSQGEFAGLMAIRRFHDEGKSKNRKICLIPTSAHGTNPASAAMAGFTVIPVQCDSLGNIDFTDLINKVEKYHTDLAALMITYPSTHGVFEEGIREIVDLIHSRGGLVYMDGANFNALVGLSRPGEWGVDVLHLNLHKTFSIPHGGGGPGVGPICVSHSLKEFLPSHTFLNFSKSGWAVSGAPFGSASILPISWLYISMMGAEGLTRASQVAILNANYIAKKLENYFPILFRGHNHLVAHECIIDLREFKLSAGVSVDDVAKRLIDYGFHAPTMSWPVAGTLMIEPTESESLKELDYFCEALISIREEIREIENKKYSTEDNVLINAPHSIEMITSDQWNHSYSREKAAYPLPWVRERKFWAPVSRVDNAFGDRNFCCTIDNQN